MRYLFDERKSKLLRANPRRGTRLEEAQQIFERPYYLDQRSDWPEQLSRHWMVEERLYSVIFEIREDADGEY
jgi:hypothetical protein